MNLKSELTSLDTHETTVERKKLKPRRQRRAEARTKMKTDKKIG